MEFKVNDTIRLLVELKEEGLSMGSIGAIVFEYEEPIEAYEVEFCNEDGETIAQTVLKPEQNAAAL
ncbi:DUF4926 domain-containing protein [Trinickia mobilis]|uniref:DUF4926 domain-containing protein n=1 Tax=Trinickia mobilis TaxID=2816356 RepID=UPI001A8DD912|nr:DUF4926 domain-containing protein [Trinickia mobilis]